jgi:hypothetical protein
MARMNETGRVARKRAAGRRAAGRRSANRLRHSRTRRDGAVKRGRGGQPAFPPPLHQVGRSWLSPVPKRRTTGPRSRKQGRHTCVWAQACLSPGARRRVALPLLRWRATTSSKKETKKSSDEQQQQRQSCRRACDEQQEGDDDEKPQRQSCRRSCDEGLPQDTTGNLPTPETKEMRSRGRGLC